MKNIKEIVKILEPKEIIGEAEGSFSSVCYNSNKCEPYSLFVAISGSKFDGHDFIDDAIARGAKYIIAEKLPDEIKPGCTYFIVENSRIALAKVSDYWFGYPTRNLQIVGITGTNGKTTISFLLKEIMQSFGLKSAVIGTLGVFAEGYTKTLRNTTPESYELFKIFKDLSETGVCFVAMEVSSHSLHQNRVYGINFAGAIFTNLTQDHLDYHKDMDEYAKAKSLLFSSLTEESVAVVFGDDPYSDKVTCSTKARRILVGRSSNSDVQILNESFGLSRTEFDLRFNSGKFNSDNNFIDTIHVETPLVGRFNVENVSLAFVAALELGVDKDTILQTLQSFSGVPGRMQKVYLKNGALGIVDYAHTPDALQKVLEACREMLSFSETRGKLICVFGCGGERDTAKRPIMGKIASELADYVVLTNDNPRKENPTKIINQIYSGITNEGKKKVIQIGNRDEAIEYAYKLSQKNDIILVAGKGHEDYQIIGEVKYHFSDIEQLEKFGVEKNEEEKVL
jgi:UDP-N-acetylmuramoyl-L-alanyl-D-glutamate--2,6-diaminopimelate ligase